ncbi:MAG: endonuclease/exonuclease/phosphatase family protein [Muribaculaceae bacterium]|nr:endonuclease/exonuclease/phosphatase family protein [Muribaculaceae bacterium]
MAAALCATAENASFNVASYNLRQMNGHDQAAGNGWERRAPIVARLIQFHDFDIFGTQEGFKNQLEDLKNAMPGYDYIGVGRDNGKEEGEHSAIFYRTDLFDVIDHGDFWLSETPDRPGLGWDAVCVRICTWGKFRHKPSGREFLFFNLHMDHVGTTARVESAKLIKRKIDEFGSDLPTFLTGDFNVDQNSPSYATITEGGKLHDAHEVSDFVYQLNGTFNNYRTDGFTDQRIDHIFVTPNVHVKKYGVLTDTYRTAADNSQPQPTTDAPSEVEIHRYQARTPSDHFPVKTIIELR